MSDNLCGPSAPTKGLINQLDRDNSRHQTRATTPHGPFDRNFRTAVEAANSGAKDADLNQFLAGPAGPPPGSLVHFPMGNLTPNTTTGPPSQVHHPNHTHDDLRRQQNIQGALLGGPGRVSTDWVNDFRNMQLNNNHWERAQGNSQFSSGPAAAQAHRGYAAPTERAVLHPPPPYANQFLNSYQAGPFLGAPQAQHGVQQTNIAQGPAMAPSEKQALDDVFAELFADVDKANTVSETESAINQTKADQEDARLRYEKNFQEEMDQWMSVNGSSAEQEELTKEGMKADAYSHPGFQDANPDPRLVGEDQHSQDLQDDYELRKAAQDIMQTLSTNKSEKFQNSTFIDLMNRICQKQVVLQGNDLFDTTTGTVLGNVTDAAGSEKTAAHDPKGKGKANEVTIEVETDNNAQNNAA